MIDTKKLTKELNDCSEGEIFLIETTASKILEVYLAAGNFFSERKYTQIVLSTSRPCVSFFNLYKKNNIDIDKLRILCTCCQENENNKQEDNGIIHIRSASSLTEISLAISKCIQTIEGKKVIIIDSVNTLLIHNNPNILAKFIHFILIKMRINDVTGLLVALEAETDKEVKMEIEQLCDKIIAI